jgi:PiT family inorganic phosphate transporter
VGAVIGVGLNKSAKSISKNTIMTILIGWVATPTLAGAVSFVLYRVINYFST